MNFHLKAHQVKVDNLQRIIMTNNKKIKVLSDAIRFVADEMGYMSSMLPDPVRQRKVHWTMYRKNE